jgi:hypothetical protein
MLALASILSAFAAVTFVYFRAPDRGKAGFLRQSAFAGNILGPAAIGAAAMSLALAVAALDWAAGIGLWVAGMMTGGVALVSVAGNHPIPAQWLGCGSAIASLLIAAVHWATV